MAKATLTWNQGALALVRQRFMQRMIIMGSDIAKQARGRAPVDTGALKASIRTEAGSNGVTVIAGGNSGGGVVAYARKREHENRKHPATIGYMRNSFTDTLSGDWQTKYFGGFV